MGCCTSSTAATEPRTPVEKKTQQSTTKKEHPPVKKPMKKPVTASKAKNAAEPTPVPSEKVVAEPTSPTKTSPVEKDSTKPVRNPAAIAAPAPGVKHVRAAYKGKGWAPPQKEWESNKKTAGDKTRIEIEDEWDEDGNLKRTTTKYTTTPDWKKTTETTVEVFSAEEAKKMGLGRK